MCYDALCSLYLLITVQAISVSWFGLSTICHGVGVCCRPGAGLCRICEKGPDLLEPEPNSGTFLVERDRAMETQTNKSCVKTYASFPQEIIEGRITGKPTRRRRQIQLLNGLLDKKDYCSFYKEWRWRQMDNKQKRDVKHSHHRVTLPHLWCRLFNKYYIYYIT